MRYTCINIQGNLITEEILQKIEEGTAHGQSNAAFGFDSSTNLRNEIEYAWSRIRLDWKNFSERSQNLSSGDPYGTSISRRWIENFLNALGFSLIRQKSSQTGDNQLPYYISHTDQNLDDLPVHIVGFIDPDHPDRNTLDIRSSGGTSRLSPHGTVQEYLNVTDHLYGIAANGYNIRLMRDSGRLVKLTYLEFDLKRMLDEDKYSEFTLLFKLMHASRFPKSKEVTSESLLESYYKESIETGNRIRDGLSLAVQESIVGLGNGFLQSPSNHHLREKILSGELSTTDFYRQLRRLVYRLLFLMVMEERDLVYNSDALNPETSRKKITYLNFYSIARLRKLSQKRYLFDEGFTDLWQGLLNTFRLFENEAGGKPLGIYPLSGELFSDDAIRDLVPCMISNSLLLGCIRNLNEFNDSDGNLVQVNYRALDVEELGSVYEGLLELHPIIENIDTENPSMVRFLFHEGTERKTTGSYYTSPDLVNELIKSALIPVIEERIAGARKCSDPSKENLEKAVLSVKVCDPAAGSGHFLLAAARTIAWYLARTRTGEENPPPSEYRNALREAIQHCVYGVDLNPDAVELCKLALWLESHNSGKPLSFLDHKIRCGNSLVGVQDLNVLSEPIPDEAFNPTTGDDPKVCKDLKRRNKEFRKTRQASLFSAYGQQASQDDKALIADYTALDGIEQNTLEAVDEIRKRFGKIRTNLYHKESACNIWTSAFFQTYVSVEEPGNPSSEKLAQFFHAPTQYGRLVGQSTALAMHYRFFHWPLEFPDVFAQGGFDVMLGNPPWEIIELKEQEFFATRDSMIATADNKAARTRLINLLAQNNFALFEEYIKESHFYEAERKFLQESNRNPLTAVGRINMYSVFAENFTKLINRVGHAGVVLPTGIATDDGNKDFFGSLIENNRLISLFDFENKEAIFPNVHRSYKFSLLTISGSSDEKRKSKFGFFLTRVEHLHEDLRVFNLTKGDFIRLNPNTKTCPIFRTSVDAELTTKIYNRVPILVNETTGENTWGIKFRQGLFNMSSDSHLFRTRQQLESVGFELWGNRMRKGNEIYLPLYEAKFIWLFDHRYETFDVNSIHHEDPNLIVIPRYWVNNDEVSEENKFYLIQRGIADMENERRMIFSVIPRSGIGNSAIVNLLKEEAQILTFCSLMNSICVDYLIRVKAQNPNLNQFVLKQLAVLPYEMTMNQKITSKALELCYVSWDLKPFLDQIWYSSSENLRNEIFNQWNENQKVTGGHPWSPPNWADQPADPNEPGYIGCPLAPFKWDEDRRAVLKAELDAIYAKLYGLTTDELRYILDPQDVYGPDFPGETFRVLKEKEIRQYGEYRTKRLVMEAWEKLNN